MAYLGVAALMLAGCAASGHGPAGRPSHGYRHSAITFTSTIHLTEAAGHPGAPAGAAAAAGQGAAAGAAAARVPQPRHIVVVIMENHGYPEIIGNATAPFVNRLARRGALFTQSYAVAHPSEPNYLALFSGSTQGLIDDSCPHSFSGRNLAADLITAGRSFTGYAEGLPAAGSAVCGASEYARKHAPWTDFSNVPGSVSQTFTRFPGRGFASLPTVSFVVPNLCHDMHGCGVPVGDTWLRAQMAGYARWATTHDSLLILTWDEDDGHYRNRIPTIFIGQMVRPGRYAERITHYSVLRTIEDAYRLRHDGHATAVHPITDIWRR